MSKGCHPNLFVLGAAKAGTSTLHDLLAQHVDIDMSLNKEPRYMCRTDKNPSDYGRQFPSGETVRFRGESSTMYFVLPTAMRAIRAHFPDARAVVLLRNPIDRAWSHYWYIRGRYGLEPRRFRDAIASDLDSTPVPTEVNQWYFQTGLYSKWLNHATSCFGSSNVHVAFFEDLRAEPASVLAGICEFLGLAPFEGVSPVHSNPTELIRAPGTLRQLERVARIGGRGARLLPVRLHQALMRGHQWLDLAYRTLMSEGRGVPSMPDAERDWIRDLYRSDVEVLNQVVPRAADVWAQDFPRSSRDTHIE